MTSFLSGYMGEKLRNYVETINDINLLKSGHRNQSVFWMLQCL